MAAAAAAAAGAEVSMAAEVEVSTLQAVVITGEAGAVPVARHPRRSAPASSPMPGPAGMRFVLMRTQAEGPNTREILPIRVGAK
jgi:hypothetical protein